MEGELVMRRAASTLTVMALAVVLAAIAHPVKAGGYDEGAPISWSGFYVGGNLGAAFDQSDLSIADLSLTDILGITSSADDGFIGGVHVGYNLQGAHILYGVEGDADFAKNINFLGSVRARLGWAGERMMVYGTLGVAFLDTDAQFTLLSALHGPLNLSHDVSEVGSVVGGGIDFKVRPKVSLGAEGLYYAFANNEARLSSDGEPFLFHDHPNFAVVRARLTYYFNNAY